jgi:hypothetical protein
LTPVSTYSQEENYRVDPEDREKSNEELLQRVKLEEGEEYTLEPGQPLVVYRLKAFGRVYERTIEIVPKDRG